MKVVPSPLLTSSAIAANPAGTSYLRLRMHTGGVKGVVRQPSQAEIRREPTSSSAARSAISRRAAAALR